MLPRPFRLSRRHRAVLYSLFALLFTSGLIWWLGDEAAEEAGKPVAWAELWKPRLMRVHGGAAMAFLVTLGTVLAVHVRRAWPSGTNRISGTGLIGWFLLQAVTGYGVLYFVGDGLRDWNGQIHVTLGLLAPAAVAGHVLWGKWIMRRRARSGGSLPATPHPGEVGPLR